MLLIIVRRLGKVLILVCVGSDWEAEQVDVRTGPGHTAVEGEVRGKDALAVAVAVAFADVEQRLKYTVLLGCT